MPKVTGTLGNCYRLSINDAVIGFFHEESVAEHISELIQEEMDAADIPVISTEIVKWFLPQEF